MSKMRSLFFGSTLTAVALVTVAAFAQALAAGPLMVDNFDGEEIQNVLGNRANVFIRAPSKCMVSRREDTVNGKKSQVLMVRYDKRNSGGPFDSGGWCGYYTLLKSPAALVAPTEGAPEAEQPATTPDQYLDGSAYKKIAFWVRGEKGDENFVIGLSDRHWDKIGDSVKSEEIGKYLPSGKLTTQWQKASIPLDEFFLDYSQLASIAVVFEGDLFPETGHAGVVYIDDIGLE